MASDALMTTVSTKGQVILPKVLREKKRWKPGTRLVVEETKDGILLKAVPLFAPTRPEDVCGMLHVPGERARTLKEMDDAIAAEVLARHARGRY
jgi:AbrB family looped-hinge helix DNA binding protein